MSTRQIISWFLLTLIVARMVFYEQMNTAFDSWRMRGCEHIKEIDAYDLGVNPVTGDLWGISYDSLFQFDGREWQFYKVPSLNAGYVTDAFIVFDPQGRMWQGGQDGMSVFVGEYWTIYGQDDWGLPDTVVTSIAFEPSGKPWVGFSSTGISPEGTCGGVSILEGERWMTYRFDNTSLIAIGCQSVQSIQFDPSGNAWIGLSNGAIMTLQQATDESFQNALPGGAVFSSAFKSTGYFLVPEESFTREDQRGPVVINDFSTKPLPNHPFLDDLSTDPIHSILFDERGNTWIIAGEKLYQSRDGKAIPAVSPSLKAVKDLQGNLWSVGGSVGMYDGTTWQVYHVGNSCIGNEDVGAIAFDKNNRAWVSRFPKFGKAFSISTFDQPPPRVPDVLLRLQAIFMFSDNPWSRWMGPIILVAVWLLILLGAKWPAFTFPLFTMILALGSERIHAGRYYPIFIFELITLFSLGGGLVNVITQGRERKEGFWKNAAPGFYGALIGLLFFIIAYLLWRRFGPSS